MPLTVFALLLLSPIARARETTVGLDTAWMVDRWDAEDGLPLNHINNLALDSDGYLWITSFEGLTCFDGDSFRTWTRAELPELQNNRLVAIEVAADSRVWLTDDLGDVYRFDPALRPLHLERMAEGVSELAMLDGQLWGFDPDRGWPYDPAGGRFGEAVPKGESPAALVEARKGGVFREGTGVVWTLRDDMLLRDGVPIAPVGFKGSPMSGDGHGGLWLATHEGLVHVRPALAHFLPSEEGLYVVRWQDEGLWAAPRMGPPMQVVGDELRPLTEMSERTLAREMRPLESGGLAMVVNGAPAILQGDGSLRTPEIPFPALSLPMSWLDTPDGSVWLFGPDGLYRNAPEGFVEIRGPEGPVGDARDLIPLDAGHFLVLAPGVGLLVVTPEGLLTPEHTPPSLDIRGARLEGDTLWLGTEDAGLCRVQPVRELLSTPIRCVAVDGERNIHNSQDDGQGRLWLGTNRGVLVVEKQQVLDALEGGTDPVSAIRLDTRDGMEVAETNGGQWSVERTPDGRLWFPTMGGLVAFDPRSLPDSAPLRPRFEAVKVQGVERAAGPLSLSSDEQELEIRWSVPEFVRAEQVRFRWRLGAGEWHEGTNLRAATWNRLPAGANTVEVRARLGGAWGPPALLQVSRAPTFVESRLFPLALVGGGAGLAAVGAELWARQRRRRVRELEDEVARQTAELRANNLAIADQARQLAEVDATKSRFVANLSHELRTPLMLVMGSLEDLARGSAANPGLALAQRNAERLRELVDQLFDVVRLDAGRLQVRARRIALADAVGDLVARHAPLAGARGITLHFEARARPEVWADRDLLEKALGNLLGNALKFTPEGGAVRVELRDEPGEARVEVADTGPGVPAEDRERIFERYVQAHAGDNRRTEGAGIGLALARELTEAQGGSLHLVPTEGPGATFALSLPTGIDHLAVQDISLEEPSGERAPVEPSPANAENPSRVLIVEDHPELRAYLAARLSEAYAVETEADGHAALARLKAGGIGLVLSDIMMPGMDGVALCRAVRATPGLEELPVVLLSAKGRAAEPEAMAAGASAFLAKPILGSELVQALRTLLPPAETTAPGARTEADLLLLERITAVATANLRIQGFSVEDLAAQVAMSPRTLQRTLQRLAGKAPLSWLQELRLGHARERLRAGLGVAEAANAVGMTPSYLSRVYSAWFGYPPSKEPRRTV